MCFYPLQFNLLLHLHQWQKGTWRSGVQCIFFKLDWYVYYTSLGELFILGQSQHGFDPTTSIIQITLLLLVPFILGQLLRPYIFPYMAKVPSIVKAFDQGSILMVVYGAFSGAVVAGLWHQVSWKTLLILTIACSVLLTIIMLLALYRVLWF